MKTSWALIVLCSFAVQAEPVNINSADARQIAGGLKGIGPKKAAAIVEYRQQHGKFKTLHDLDKVRGIGAKTVQALAPDILFDDGATPPDNGQAVGKRISIVP